MKKGLTWVVACLQMYPKSPKDMNKKPKKKKNFCVIIVVNPNIQKIIRIRNQGITKLKVIML